jgi:hypothetical protein
MSSANNNIINIKNNIQTDFIADDAEASLENIDIFLQAKNEYYFAKTYIVYINNFL